MPTEFKGFSGKPPKVDFVVVENNRLTQDTKNYIKDKHAEGVPVNIIASDLGLIYSRVYTIVQRMDAKNKEKDNEV